VFDTIGLVFPWLVSMIIWSSLVLPKSAPYILHIDIENWDFIQAAVHTGYSVRGLMAGSLHTRMWIRTECHFWNACSKM
jgi:hypothetical protein